MERKRFVTIEMHYGCPKHLKGEHDTKIGNLMNMFESATALDTTGDLLNPWSLEAWHR